MDPTPEPAPEPRPNGHDRPEEPEREAPPKKPPLRDRVRRWRRAHPRGFVVLLVLALVAVLAGIGIWWYLHTFESTDDAQIDGHISPVSARVAGIVTGVYVEDNQWVEAGKLLAELDPRDYQVALARAQAELARAQAELEAEHPNVPITSTVNRTQLATSSEDVTNAQAAVMSAERERDAALARIKAAEATEARAQADLTRYKYLLAQRAIPQARYDEVAATAKAARADVDAARATARGAQKAVDQQRARLAQAQSRQAEVQKNAPRQLDIKQASLDAKQAAVRAAQAAVERAKLDLAYTKVVAPIAGVVGRRSVEPGQHVQPGEALVAIVDLDHLWVTANFKETQLRHIRVGQKVRVSVDALKTKLDGTVESIAGASGARYSLLPPENATGNFVKVVQRVPVRIELAPGQDPQHRLRIGMSVEPRVRVN